MLVSSTVSEIFSVKGWRDLETGGRGPSRSLKMAPIDRPYYTTSYLYAIVSIVCVVLFLSYLTFNNRDL